MKKFIKILFVTISFLFLIIIIFPKFSNKETCTYEEAVKKYAKGKIVTVNNKKMHYIEKGKGTPVIFIHGFFYNTIMWKNNIDAFAKHYKVYAVDLFGWGYSERLDPKEYSFDLYREQIIGFMNALKIKKAILIGQSMGGGTSINVAAYYPDRVEKLILVDPAVIPYETPLREKIYELPFVGEFLNALPGDSLMINNIKNIWFYDKNKVSEEYAKELIQPFCIKNSYAGMMYILRSVLRPPYVENAAHKLAKLKKPILIIHGREDTAVPLDRSQTLITMWKGAKLVIFEKARHSPHEEYPDKFNKLALEFLLDKK